MQSQANYCTEEEDGLWKRRGRMYGENGAEK
jgi:hypothetical protein